MAFHNVSHVGVGYVMTAVSQPTGSFITQFPKSYLPLIRSSFP